MSKSDKTVLELIAENKKKIAELQALVAVLEAAIGISPTDAGKADVVEDNKANKIDYERVFIDYAPGAFHSNNEKYLYIMNKLGMANLKEFTDAYTYLHPEHGDKAAAIFRQGNQVYSKDGTVSLQPDSRSSDGRAKVTVFEGLGKK